MGALNVINDSGASITLDSNSDVPEANLPPGIARDSELPTVNNGTLTVSGGSALTGSGTFTANQSGNATITLNHQDTSTQGSVSNSSPNFIRSITLDTYGHVTGITSAAAATGTPAITGMGSYILMQGTRRNFAYSEGQTFAPTGNGQERYGVTFGRSTGSGSGDFQQRTSTTQGGSISGGTWRCNSAGVTNQYAVTLAVRIS